MLMLIVFALFLCYVGKAWGFLMLTYNAPSLRLARRIYMYVPYITAKLLIYYVIDLIKEKDYRKIFPVLFLDNKMAIVGLSMIYVANEYAAKHPKTTPNQAIRRFKYIKKEKVLKTYAGYVTQCVA